MAHHRYQTEGIVISRFSRGESNSIYTILTKDLGLVHAAAQGARLPQSKLRPHLAAFSHVRIDMIRGKEMWRLVDAEQMGAQPPSTHEALMVYARISKLVRRLVHGEREEDKLFSDLREFRDIVSPAQTEEKTIRTAEIAIAALILSHLGYGGEDDEWRVADGGMSALMHAISEKPTLYVKRINERLAATHL